MFKRPPANAPADTDLRWTLAQIAAIWGLSDIGFYLLPAALGSPAGLGSISVALTIYYVFWVGISVITFWPLYGTWQLHVKWTTFENRFFAYGIWTLAFIGFVAFAVYIVPSLPKIDWQESWNPPEIVRATEWYFLPKSIDIFFQQLLVLALVLALAARKYSIRRISLYVAILFGGTHILLAFDGVPLGYIVRFGISAAVFGAIFPYLILRVPNGMAYSYIVHWIYYAVSVVLPHIFLSKTFSA